MHHSKLPAVSFDHIPRTISLPQSSSLIDRLSDIESIYYLQQISGPESPDRPKIIPRSPTMQAKGLITHLLFTFNKNIKYRKDTVREIA